jgi:hypothetical protein
MRRQRLLLDAYLGSAAFAAARDRVLRAPPHRQRGVLVNAGGRKLLTHLVVTLRVLRHHLNCTLPVEVAWHGAAAHPLKQARSTENVSPA